MIDTVLSFLSPDSEILEECLSELGKRHARHGPQYLPSLQKLLAGSCRKFWETIGLHQSMKPGLTLISDTMTEGIVRATGYRL